jgi:dolichol-phosphate mannosyltransferase
MPELTRVSLIVPFYNEEEGIPSLAERLTRLDHRLSSEYEMEYVLVDDGSQDNGMKIARKLLFARLPRVVYGRHECNRGLGAAIRTGFSLASGDILVSIDSDCTYDPMDVPKLLSALAANDAEIATGSPYHPEGGVENVVGWRLLLSRGASFLYRCICPCKLYTYTSMMRAYRRHVVEGTPFESDGFAAVTEILLEASFRGFRIVEVPLMLHSRKTGVSKMKVARTIRIHLQLLFDTAWRRATRALRLSSGIPQKEGTSL